MQHGDKIIVRLPTALESRLHTVAAGVNGSKPEVVRYWLSKLGEGDLPSGWREDAEGLRAARAAR